MSTAKRWISLLLVLGILLGVLPPAAQAAPVEETASVNTGDVTIQGTNGFGALLSQEINENQNETAAEASEYPGGYTVTDLEIVDGTATVTYDTMENATLVVALYTEDGMQLLTSGTTAVTPEGTEATVTFGGELPEFFMASAYLVDQYDYSPLCPAYDTPMYTREMQALLDSTVDDYDSEKVLNLDEDKTTNFAVYADSTIIIEPVAGKNTVASIDDESATYVIKNADAQVTGLKAGDVFSYAYGDEELLIVKVGAIVVDGTTVTIIGSEVQMEEVFSAMKLENSGTTEDMVVDENSGDEGVTYIGMQPDDAVNPNAWDDNAEKELSLGFKVEKKIDDYSRVSGSLGVNFKMEFEYYISWSRQFIRFEQSADTTIKLGYEFKAGAPVPKATSKLKLKSFGFRPVAGLYIGFEPEVVVEFTATVELACKLKTSGGFTYENGKGCRDLAKKPSLTIDVKVEGVVFFGIDFGPHISILSDDVAKIGLSAQVGFELTGKAAGYLFEDIPVAGEMSDVIHDCDLCYKMDLAVKSEFALEIQLLKSERLSFETKLAAKRYKLGLLYYSVAFKDFGFGDCPHKSYRLTVSVLDEDSQPSGGAVVKVGGQSQKTNESGAAAFYLTNGKYIVTCDWGDTTGYKNITMDEPKKLKFVKGEPPEPENSFGEDSDFGAIDNTGYIAHGSCGENAYWKIYANGRMVISGTGAVTNASWGSYKKYITELEIENGITTICANAFSGCTAIEKMTIADSVTSLGLNAFNGCTGLREVTMPCDVGITVKTGYSDFPSSFTGCINVRTIHYTYGRTGVMPNRTDTNYNNATSRKFTLEYNSRNNLQKVTFDEGITHIGDYTFYGCPSLIEAVIPSTVDSFGHYAFSGCQSLQNIDWPEDIVFLGAGAFENCGSFTQIDLPTTLTTIRENTFAGCTGLTSLEIPDSVTSLGLNAFYGCTRIKEVTMPCDVGITVQTGYSEFPSSFTGCINVRSIRYTYGRTGVMPNRTDTNYNYPASRKFTLEYKSRNNLQKVTFDEGITHIGDYAFCGCASLTEAVIPSTVDSFGHYAFSGCQSLQNINWPEDIVFLGAGAFENCGAFTQIDLPDTLTTIRENTFAGCISLASVRIPDSVTSLGLNAFYGCTGLREVTMPCDVLITVRTGSSDYPSSFTGCTNVRTLHYTYGRTGIMANWADKNYNYTNSYRYRLEWKSRERLGTVTFAEGITQIGDYAFADSTRLTSVTLPSTLDTLGNYSLAGCSSLEELTFRGDAPFIAANAFKGDILTCYYPTGNGTWTERDMKNYGGTVTWKPYAPGTRSAAVEAPVQTEPAQPEVIACAAGAGEQPLKPDAVYEGEYGTEIVENGTLKTASFNGLVAGEQYLLLAVKSIDADDPLGADNLLFIDQAPAEADGTLRFVYFQRENAPLSYVVACGASNKNLKDAQITFPEMYDTGLLQAVEPIVVYGGNTLTEGLDYIVVGTASFTESGAYTCSIRGIHNYTGLVVCSYTVADHKHSYTNYVSNGDANCTDDGTKTAKCDHCDQTSTVSDVGSALGHAFTDWVVLRAPTTAEDGAEERTCSRCGYTEQRSIPRLQNPFADVAVGSFFYEPVLWAVANGITNGTSATTFGPNDQCMRAQVVTFLWRAVGSPEPTAANNPFVDVKPSDYYYKPVLWALENGITAGVDATHFGPTSYCNRAQVVTFLHRTMDSPVVTNTQNPFVDVPAGQWFTAPVLWAVENGITAGMDATHFEPNSTCNRAQIVTFLYRAFVD